MTDSNTCANNLHITYDYSLASCRPIYINLDRSGDRREFSANQYAKANFAVDRFTAIDGLKLVFQNLQTGEIFTGLDLKNNMGGQTEVGVEYSVTYAPQDISFNFLGKKFSAGEFGIIATHLAAWKQALEMGCNKVIIFEDDNTIKDPDNFQGDIDNIIAFTPTNADIVFIDYSPIKGTVYPLENNNYVSAVNPGFWAWGMNAALYTKAGMEKLLSVYRYDGEIDGSIWKQASYSDPDKLAVYVASNDLVYNVLPSILNEMGRNHGTKTCNVDVIGEANSYQSGDYCSGEHCSVDYHSGV